MKVCICGSRSITLLSKIHRVMDELALEDVDELVSGGARGVDRLGELWAEEHNIPIKRFPANWDLYGRSAGPVRNIEMAKYLRLYDGVLVALWDGKSKGTQHMINYCLGLDLTVHVADQEGRLLARWQRHG